MSRKYKFWDSNQMYFISFATVHWIDVFTRNEYKDELVKCFQYCKERKGLETFAWCIMPSHVHMLISSHDKPLEDIVRDTKSYTSTQLRKLIKEHPQESRREWMIWIACPDFFREWKEPVRKTATTMIGSEYFREQQHNKPLEITGDKMYAETVWYIHQNPVVAGFVYEAVQWVQRKRVCKERRYNKISRTLKKAGYWHKRTLAPKRGWQQCLFSLRSQRQYPENDTIWLEYRRSSHYTYRQSKL